MTLHDIASGAVRSGPTDTSSLPEHASLLRGGSVLYSSPPGRLLWWQLEKGVGQGVRVPDDPLAPPPAAIPLRHSRRGGVGTFSEVAFGGIVARGVDATSDGARIAAGCSDQTIKIWDTATGELMRSLRGHGAPVYAVRFSADGKLIVSGGHDQTVRLWDASTGALLFTFEGHEDEVHSVDISPDGQLALSGSDDGVIILWDLRARRLVRRFPGREAAVRSLQFLPSRKYFLSASEGGVLRVSAIDTGASVSLIESGDDWLIYTDDGLFDASREGGRLVGAAQGLHGYQIEQLAVRNNRPDLILQRLGIADREAVEHYRGWYDRRLDQLGLSAATLGDRYDRAPVAEIVQARRTDKIAELEIRLTSPFAELKRFNVYVNGVPVHGAPGMSTSGHEQTIIERVELTSGPNRIEVSAHDASGLEALRPVTSIEYPVDVKGDLYFFGFGVSRYKDATIKSLDFADKDARDLADVFRSAGGTRQFRRAFAWATTNEQVTKAAFESVKRALSKSGVDDTVILFVAGHGVSLPGPLNEFLYLPSATDVSHLEDTGVSLRLIEGLLDGIAPRRKLLLLDSCDSGEAEEGGSVSATPPLASLNPRTIRALRLRGTAAKRRAFDDRERYIYNDLARRTGAILLASSRRNEISYEGSDLKNGVFTQYLLEALTTSSADADRNGTLDLGEARRYLAAMVPAFTGGQQHPNVTRDNPAARLEFPVLTGARFVVDRDTPGSGR